MKLLLCTLLLLSATGSLGQNSQPELISQSGNAFLRTCSVIEKQDSEQTGLDQIMDNGLRDLYPRACGRHLCRTEFRREHSSAFCGCAILPSRWWHRGRPDGEDCSEIYPRQPGHGPPVHDAVGRERPQQSVPLPKPKKIGV